MVFVHELKAFEAAVYLCVCDLTARRETHRSDSAGGAALRHQSRHQHQNQPGGAAGRLQPRQPHRNVHGGRTKRASGASCPGR